jgi:hypothetical protein
MSTLVAWGGNRIFSSRVKSLTSIVNGDWQNRPVMTLNSSDVLSIGFDEFLHNYHRLVYHLDHCEADWSVSEDIFESDWLHGFNDEPIDNYLNSINTTVLYTHYQLTIPNDRCQLTMSGNYRLTVYDEDNANEKLLEVEFYVVEPVMTIGMEATTNTDIDHNVSHQQLSISLLYNNLRITNRDEQLYTVVMQNWQEDAARHNIQPNHITPHGLLWQHNRQLIFDGGNEFHKFEVLDVTHPTMGIDRIRWDGTNYQVYPFAATVCRNYLTDVDTDGAFCIRNSDNFESEHTCDYVWVNYRLHTPQLLNGNIYVQGRWTTEKAANYLMHYNAEEQVYQAYILQKQGYYSYQYLWQKNDGTSHFLPSEGNFYQTENRYQAYIYYKKLGERTWRLTAAREILSE